MKSIKNQQDKFIVIEYLMKGVLTEIAELNFICILWETVFTLQEVLSDFSSTKYLLDLSNRWEIQKLFVNPFRRFIDVNGHVDYYQHPELKTIFMEVEGLQKQIKEQLESTIKKWQDDLQYPHCDLLDDYYVLPLKADRYQRYHGKIVAKSNTALTLYVEPPEIREISSKRRDLLYQIQLIINKICIDFSHIIKEKFLSVLIASKNYLLEIDHLNAKALFAISHQLVRPSFNSNHKISIRGLFHPLLANPIKNDLEINPENLGICLSGANTGGKTVFMKSICLCFLFPHFGIFVPAKSCDLYLTPAIYFFCNGEQNMQQNLSSFSAEVHNYLRMLAEVEDDSLIFLDEIFNSTSSEEASALALGLFNELYRKINCKIFLSTHHHLLKIKIHEEQKLISAHVVFDPVMQKPTFQINFQGPGSSMALPIFRQIQSQLEIDTSIVEFSEQILSEKYLFYENMLQKLSEKNFQLEKVLKENMQINLHLKNLEQSQAGQINFEKQKVIATYQKKIDKIFQQAKELISDLKNPASSHPKNHFQQTLNGLQNSMREEKSKLQLTPPSCDNSDIFLPDILKETALQIGETYYALTLGKRVKVLAVDLRKKSATVQFQTKRFKISTNELRALKNKVAKRGNNPEFIFNRLDHTEYQLEIDCRGLKADEFLHSLAPYLAQLENEEIPYLQIIHGHGEGILKKLLRDFLESATHFHWENDQGNDGVTRIYLKATLIQNN